MRLGRPIKSYVRITQRFSPPVHFGLDLSAYVGTPVYAVTDGVAFGRVQDGGFGRYVRIETPEAKFYSAHLDTIIIGEGQPVKRGAIIGYSGSTGNSTGPHLHVEVRRNAGSPYTYGAIDPWPLIDWDAASARRRVTGVHLGNGCVLSATDRRVISMLHPGCVVLRPNYPLDKQPVTLADIAWILSVVPDCHVILRPQVTALLSSSDAGCRQYIESVLGILPAWQSVVPGGQLHVQLWNEPNVPFSAGGTGFGNSEADMLRLNAMFAEGYRRIKERYSQVIVGFPPLGPGNRDVWFPGNPAGRYFMHGTSGCRGTETMTASDWDLARSGGPCYEALNLADEIYAHTYVHNRDGVLSCWNHAAYGRRFEALRYWWPTKPMWITEYGYPNKQLLDQAGASQTLLSHANYMLGQIAFVRSAALWTLGNDPAWGGTMFTSDGRPTPLVRDLTLLQGPDVPAPSPEVPLMAEDKIGSWVSDFLQDHVLPLNANAALYKAAKLRNPRLTPASDERRPAELPITLPDTLPADIVCQVFRDPLDDAWQEIAWTRIGEYAPSQIRWIRRKN
ncbi:MAG: M23 family metallopeptidase [Anaerolineae bacterium]